MTLKSGLGHAGIHALLHREVALTERTARLAVLTLPWPNPLRRPAVTSHRECIAWTR